MVFLEGGSVTLVPLDHGHFEDGEYVDTVVYGVLREEFDPA